MTPGAGGAQVALDLWAGGAASPELLIERIHAVRARAVHGLALLPLAGGSDPRRAPLIGFALGARDGTTCYVPLVHSAGPNLPRDQVAGWLGPALADMSLAKVGEDLKRDLHLFHGLGLASSTLDFDLRLVVEEAVELLRSAGDSRSGLMATRAQSAWTSAT